MNTSHRSIIIVVPKLLLSCGDTASTVVLEQEQFCACDDCEKSLSPYKEVICVERELLGCELLEKFYFCSIQCQRYDYVTRKLMETEEMEDF